MAVVVATACCGIPCKIGSKEWPSRSGSELTMFSLFLANMAQGLLLAMGLVQSPIVLTTSALEGTSAKTPGDSRHEEDGDHLRPHDNRGPALHNHKRSHEQERLQFIRREKDKQSPTLLTSALGGTSAETPRDLADEEHRDHHFLHNQGSALFKHKRSRGHEPLQFIHRGRVEDRASDRGRQHTKSSVRLEFDDTSVTPIQLPPTNECVTSGHHSSAMVTNSFGSTVLVRASNIWKRLQQAPSARNVCQSPPCCQVSTRRLLQLVARV